MCVSCWIKHRRGNTSLFSSDFKDNHWHTHTQNHTRTLAKCVNMHTWISFPLLLWSASQSPVFVYQLFPSHIVAHQGTHLHMCTCVCARPHTQTYTRSLPLFTHTTCHMVWFPDVSCWNNNLVPAHLSSLHRHFAALTRIWDELMSLHVWWILIRFKYYGLTPHAQYQHRFTVGLAFKTE